jgi:hypothetical protein
VIFDPATIRDHAAIQNPQPGFLNSLISSLSDFVLASGVPVIEKGKIAIVRGKLLRGPGTCVLKPPPKNAGARGEPQARRLSAHSSCDQLTARQVEAAEAWVS